MLVKVKRALISVSDKQGLVDFARGLHSFGVEIISTGGTAKVLKKEKIPVTDVASVTKFPEMMDGRVKTLHPHIHAAILADRSKDSHLGQIEALGIEPIDLVVVNLYPFAETIAKPKVTLKEAIEQIDIGGPTMIRSAAKNFEGVAVVVSPERYPEILAEMKENKGSLTRETRFDLATEAFRHTASYDSTIYGYLEREKGFPPFLPLAFEKIQDLRYGENPHQKAAYYREKGAPPHSLVYAEKLHGKELSFNNILDLEAAWSLIGEFTVPAAVVIKHTNPCGVALGKDIVEAYVKAREADPVSAFGSVVALNRVIDEPVAKKITETFVEAVIAPAYTEEAVEELTKKKNLRLMYMGEEREPRLPVKDMRRVEGGLLVQDKDQSQEERKEMKVATKKKPTEKQWDDLLFAWRVAKHVHSNTIVLAKDLQTVGIGAGQMSRADASHMAVKKAGKKAKGAVMASDAFFPFPDALEIGAKAGAVAVIQPGGSVRDEEVIAVADKLKVPMVMTGIRHFKH